MVVSGAPSASKIGRCHSVGFSLTQATFNCESGAGPCVICLQSTNFYICSTQSAMNVTRYMHSRVSPKCALYAGRTGLLS